MTRRKPILWILNHYAHPPNEPGGTRHYDFARELSDEFDVIIFASAFDHRKKKSRIPSDAACQLEEVAGVKFVWVKNIPYSGNSPKRFLNMLDFAWRLYFVGQKFEKPDIIIGSSVHLFTCLSGYFLAKKLGARFILEIRDLWPQTLIDMKVFPEKHPIVWVFKVIEKFLYKKAEKIITLLPFAGEYITKLGIDEKKIVYISNGVYLKNFEGWDGSVPEEVKRILDEHRGKFTALYSGAHGKANALEVIIEAARILQEKGEDHIHFLMVGDGPLKQSLIQLCEGYGLRNIFFYPSVKKESMPALLKNVDVNLVSMLDVDLYRYGISLNKLFDYLSSGRPTVFAGRVRNDIVKESNSGFSVEPENPEAFAGAVLRMSLLSPEEREYLGKNGVEYVRNHFDIPYLANKLKKLLLE